MTVTLSVAAVVKLPSLACKVKLAFIAWQLATMLAVTTPFVLTMLETVTPFDGLALVMVTETPPGPLSMSLTVAI